MWMVYGVADCEYKAFPSQRAESRTRAPLPPRPQHRLDRHLRPGRGAGAEIRVGGMHLGGDGIARGELAEHVARLLARGGDEIAREIGEFDLVLAGERGER